MTKTSAKKCPNRKPTAAVQAAATKKKLSSFANTSTSKPRKKTRKNVSHQQTIQARDTLDAEYRDWRTGTTSTVQNLQPPNGSTTTTPMTVPQATGLGSSVPISEQSVQDLAGVLSAL